MKPRKTIPQKKVAETIDLTTKRAFVIPLKIQYLLIAMLSFILYANTLSLDYALDDRLIITDNQFTKKGISGIKEIVSNDAFTGFFGTKKSLVAGGRYRPLTQVMFAVEYQFFGLNPFVGHFVNLILFTVISVILFFILNQLLAPYQRARWLGSLAFITTILFVAHPIHTEVVANIKGRDELMSLLGSLGALAFAMKYINSEKIWALLGVFFCFLVAAFSKENSFTFIAIIPLVLYFFYKPKLINYGMIMIALSASAALFLLARAQVVGAMLNTAIAPEILNDPFLNVPKSSAIATVIYTWGKYLVLLIFPHPLTHDYYPFQIPYFQLSDPIIVFLVVTFISVLSIAIWGVAKKKLWSFAILFFLITFSIQSNLIFNIGTFMNERFVFVPSIGIALLIAYGFWLWSESRFKSVAINLFFMLILVGYSAKTISRNFAWKNDKTLFLTDVNVSSNSIKCNVSAGGTCVEMAKLEPDTAQKQLLIQQGFKYLQKAQTLHPGSFYAWFLMGNGYIELQNWEQALPNFERACQINPQSKEAVNNIVYLAQISSKNQQFLVSVKAYQFLSQMDSANVDYSLMVADGLSRIGKADSAIRIIDAILSKNSSNASAWSKKGEIFGRVKNDLAYAEILLQKSIELNPNDFSANENLGIVYGIKKQFPKSIYYFNKAISIDSSQARVYQNLAGTYLAIGDKRNAQACINKAKSIAK